MVLWALTVEIPDANPNMPVAESVAKLMENEAGPVGRVWPEVNHSSGSEAYVFRFHLFAEEGSAAAAAGLLAASSGFMAIREPVPVQFSVAVSQLPPGAG